MSAYGRCLTAGRDVPQLRRQVDGANKRHCRRHIATAQHATLPAEQRLPRTQHKLQHKVAKAFAPATIANLGPGFDWMGCAVEVKSSFTLSAQQVPVKSTGTLQQSASKDTASRRDKASLKALLLCVKGEGDIVIAEALPDLPNGEVIIQSITGDDGRLPLVAAKNCVGIAAIETIKLLGDIGCGVALTLQKVTAWVLLQAHWKHNGQLQSSAMSCQSPAINHHYSPDALNCHLQLSWQRSGDHAHCKQAYSFFFFFFFHLIKSCCCSDHHVADLFSNCGHVLDTWLAKCTYFYRAHTCISVCTQYTHQRMNDELVQGLPLGSGMGSSAASAAAGACAVNALFGSPLTKEQLILPGLASEATVSGYHADNIAPALLGGFVLVRQAPVTTATSV